MPVMSRSARGVAALTAAVLRVEELEAQLEAAKAEVKRLEEVELPAAFTEDGVSEIAIPGCPKAKRDVSVRGSFPSPFADTPNAFAKYEAARDWVIANQHEDSLKAVVTAEYDAGDRAAALASYERLRGDNRAHIKMVETVHSSTLRAIVRDRVNRALPVDPEALGCTVIRKVKLATKPRGPVPLDEDV